MIAVGAAKVHSKLRGEWSGSTIVGGPDDESVELLGVSVDLNFITVVRLVDLHELLVEAVRGASGLGGAWAGSPEEFNVLGIFESSSVPTDADLRSASIGE